MDKVPESVSAATIARARKLAKNALEIDINPGTVRWVDAKDMLFFMFTNGPDLCIVFCSPTCYFVELHTEDEFGELHENYLMLKNIRTWLFFLRRHKYHDCEQILDMPTLLDDDEE